jgi:hypothetical protein
MPKYKSQGITVCASIIIAKQFVAPKDVITIPIIFCTRSGRVCTYVQNATAINNEIKETRVSFTNYS